VTAVAVSGEQQRNARRLVGTPALGLPLRPQPAGGYALLVADDEIVAPDPAPGQPERTGKPRRIIAAALVVDLGAEPVDGRRGGLARQRVEQQRDHRSRIGRGGHYLSSDRTKASSRAMASARCTSRSSAGSTSKV